MRTISRSPDAAPGNAGAFDWASIAFVVFDVDGTLYRQRPLRLRMAAELAIDGLTRLSLDAIRIVGRYRKLREEMPAGTPQFELRLRERTAEACGAPLARVHDTVDQWLDRRPLPHLAGCVYPGTAALFAALRRSGRRIGVWSDYPATDKLTAMGLEADYIAHAADPRIDALKPDPRGLVALMDEAGATPATTLMIGDRIERDGEAARAAGTHAILRMTKPAPGWTTVADFTDPIFAPVLDAPA